MPTLHWIGKDKVINHHQDVPFRLLNHQYGALAYGTQTTEPTGSGNQIIHGDNLEALKALLPQYEGRVKCIYIDPPYNTGNEGWVYNDNVNDPKIKKWLSQVVGKEGEDLSRHDKWLCMMYPRLKLLHKLLAEDGIIFCSIDDNEEHNLKIVFNELFGAKNMLASFTWRTEGNFDNQAKIKINHEYILAYCKNAAQFPAPQVIDPSVGSGSKLFNTHIRNTIVKNGPKNPITQVTLPAGFPAEFESGTIKKRTTSWPHYQSDAIIKDSKLTHDVVVESGWSSKEVFLDFIKNGFSPILDSKGQQTTFVIMKSGAIENVKVREASSHVVSSLSGLGSTQSMSAELKKMGISFSYPKPVELVTYLISMVADKDAIILDSFAGSGTTADAVLKLNQQQKDSNRKFILIEMMDYAEHITAERVKRVMQGYAGQPGTGGSFDYLTLGEPVFTESGELNEQAGLAGLRQYIYYAETKQALSSIAPAEADNAAFLARYDDTAYYFHYEPDAVTTLGHDFLATMRTRAGQYIIYADNCLLTPEFMTQHGIIFKKIPRDISRF
jgi:adenine-specific DNA-methyltransferase